MRDSVDAHVERWAKELTWMDPVKEAVFARLAIVVRHANTSRVDLLEADGIRRWQFKILLMLRRSGSPHSASPSRTRRPARAQSRRALGAARPAGTRRSDRADGRRRRPPPRARVADPAGHDAFEKSAANAETAEAELLTALTDRERRTLANLLRKLVVAIESETPRP
jgi:hypothetical protein